MYKDCRIGKSTRYLEILGISFEIKSISYNV